MYRLGVKDAERQIHWIEAVGVECLTKSARKTKGCKDHKKKVKQGSRAQDPDNELIPKKKGHTHKLSPGTVAERPTGKATHTRPRPRTITPGQARTRPRTSSRLLGLTIFTYIIFFKFHKQPTIDPLALV